MALTQDQLAAQMVAQLRILDPSISGEIGTPERKIIDTVAQKIAEAQVDLNLLSGGQDLDSKFGTDLDAYVGLFSFGRQSGAFSVGFVTFGRASSTAYDIVIPRGTQVQGAVTTSTTTTTLTYQTSTAVTLVAGATEVIAPIEALIAGAQSNVAATVITQFANLGAPPLGITTVTNAVPTTGGSDAESDAELKVRFRNTVFRNVSGTEDQYMALALATQFSTKANVLGPISRYHEYIQVPFVDDSEIEAPTASLDATATNASPILTGVSVTSGVPLVGNGITGPGLGADVTIKDINAAGTTYTLSENYVGGGGTFAYAVVTGEPSLGPGNGLADQWTTSPSNNPYAKYIYLTVPNFVSNGSNGADAVFYRQDSDFTLNAPPVNAGDTHREFIASPPEILDPATTPFQPNVTFFNVYEGGDATVTLPTPGQVLLLEYSYMSAESRNDLTRNVLNCVDVYVDGQNPITADAVVPALPGGVNLFTDLPTDKFYRQNFRRIGYPNIPPSLSHIFTGLFWQPVTALPDQIVVDDNTYVQGTHYWAVEDITSLHSTVRSRNGIEWDPTAPGEGGGDAITDTEVESLTISGYTYDKNIVDLQAALEGAKQVTTDVLAHAATLRYLKLDVTVVYASGVSPAVTNAVIAQNLQTFLAGQYFGTTIQLTDLLLAVRNASGVQNVRWSNDIAVENTLNRVTYCDVAGNPLQENIAATAINGANSLTGVILLTTGIPAVGQVITSQAPDVFPPGTFITNILGTTYTLSENFTGSNGTYDFVLTDAFNEDFFLLDSELPTLPTDQIAGDTLPGLIVRARAQNTFERF